MNYNFELPPDFYVPGECKRRRMPKGGNAISNAIHKKIANREDRFRHNIFEALEIWVNSNKRRNERWIELVDKLKNNNNKAMIPRKLLNNTLGTLPSDHLRDIERGRLGENKPWKNLYEAYDGDGNIPVKLFNKTVLAPILPSAKRRRTTDR